MSATNLRVGRSTLTRIHFIHAAIKAGQYPNVPKLAKMLEISPRSIERDLEMMRDLMGAPLVYLHSRKGYYYGDNSYSIPPIRLSEGELVAVFLGEKLLAQYKGHPYENQIKNAYTKIQALFPESAEIDYDAVERTVSFAADTLRGEEQLLLKYFQVLQEAIALQKSVRAIYYTVSRDSQTTRLVDPYHLRFQAGAWYCIGYCHSRKEFRTFALDRFLMMELTDQCFEKDERFSINEYLEHSLNLERGDEPQEVAIFFDRYAARWVRERRWHESQEIAEQADGSLVLRLQVSGLGEVKRWVMSFGRHAEVLSPPELREEVTREVKEMAENYR